VEATSSAGHVGCEHRLLALSRRRLCSPMTAPCPADADADLAANADPIAKASLAEASSGQVGPDPSLFQSPVVKKARRKDDDFREGAADDGIDVTGLPATVAGCSLQAFIRLPRNAPEPDALPAPAASLMHLNRYMDVLPNAHTRVPLSDSCEMTNCLRYMNANFVRGADGKSVAYIAAMGPLATTKADFWQMVWDQNSSIIVMLTGLEEGGIPKCVRYWPKEADGDGKVYGSIRVNVSSVNANSGYVHSVMSIQRSGECREVHHFWYKSWPDHGAPNAVTSILDMLCDIRAVSAAHTSGPWVVHCSAGIGRTGTFIAIDMGSHQLACSRRTALLGLIRSMREDRGSMVQSPQQAEFAQKALNTVAKELNNAATACRWQDSAA